MRIETAQGLLLSICCTLDEGLSGAPRKTLLTADLEAYLRGILAENALLAAFDAALVLRVLDTNCPIWRDAR